MPKFDVVYKLTIEREYIVAIWATDEEDAEKTLLGRLEKVTNGKYPGVMENEDIGYEIESVDEQ